jgi:hypothetical protein
MASEPNSRLSPRAWAVTGAAVALVLVAQLVPVPGLEVNFSPNEDAQNLWTVLGLHPPYWALLGSGSVFTLAFVRGVVALVSTKEKRSNTASLVGFAVFLLLVGAQAELELRVLNNLQGPPAGPGGYTVLAAVVLANAALWGLALAVTRWGVGHGPLMFVLAIYAFSAANSLIGENHWGWATFLLPMLVVAFALKLYRPTHWPIQVARAAWALSPVDCLAVPFLLCNFQVTSFAFGLASGLGARWLELVATAISMTILLSALGCAVGVALWLKYGLGVEEPASA